MGIFLWIVLGALAGWIASTIMKVDVGQGLFGDIILGILGAIVGGLVLGFFGQTGLLTGFSIYSILVATIGSVVLIWLGRVMYRVR